MIYIKCAVFGDPDTHQDGIVRKIKIYNEEITLEIASEDVQFLQVYERDDRMMTIILTECWIKVVFLFFRGA